MFRSIRWRLILSYVLLTFLTVTLVGVLGISLVHRYVQQREVEHLTANAKAVARQALPLIWPVVREWELQELTRTSSFLGDVQVRILDKDRHVLADSRPSAEGDDFVWALLPLEWHGHVSGDEFAPVVIVLPHSDGLRFPLGVEERLPVLAGLPADTTLTHVRQWADTWGSRFVFERAQGPLRALQPAMVERPAPRSERVITVPIEGENRLVGYVELGYGPDLGTKAVTATAQAFLVAGAGAMVIAVVIGLVVSRRFSAPLSELTAVAGEMSGGDLSTRACVRGKDEIGQLAGQFNRMAERLEASFGELAAERDALRRFIADASHELRTPITALKNFIDLLQDAAAEDPDARAEFLTESQVQLERLEWITGNLLDLSRLDAGLVELDLADHDVGELIDSASSAFKPLAQDKEVDLSVLAPVPPVELRCDRARMEMALSNLLDNALRFTPAGGAVVVGGELSGEVVRLWVRDTGSSIDPEDLPHIFERFYRGRKNHGEGSGLGLAIVQSVVQAHGGEVTVESEPGAGSLFVIELPQG
jgi:signal transduction histidine kinase